MNLASDNHLAEVLLDHHNDVVVRLEEDISRLVAHIKDLVMPVVGCEPTDQHVVLVQEDIQVFVDLLQ